MPSQTVPAIPPAAFPAILLAAGKSSRLGVPKGLYPVNGRPWIVAQLASLEEAGLRAIIVVLGHDSERYLRLPELAITRTVLNPAPNRGQFSSLQLGLQAALERDVPGAFVLPIDTPCPEPAVWRALAGELRDGIAACLPQVEGQGGHPCLVSAALARELVALAPDHAGSRLDVQLSARPPGAVRRVPCRDPRTVMNLNTPEAFARELP